MRPDNESPIETLKRLREEEREEKRRSDQHFDLFMERYTAKVLGTDQGIDGSILNLREATYQTHDGRHVYYDNGDETLRDAADLYTVLEELHGTGSPNVENQQALHILARLQSGDGLGQMHLSTLIGLLGKHKDKIEALRASGNRDGQDLLATASAGPDGSIVDPGKLPAKTQEATPFRAESGSFAVRLRESKEETHMREAERPAGGLLATLGIDKDELDAVADPVVSAAPAAEPGRRARGLSLREAVLMGEVSLNDVISGDGMARLRELNNTNGSSLLDVLGIDRADLNAGG